MTQLSFTASDVVPSSLSSILNLSSILPRQNQQHFETTSWCALTRGAVILISIIQMINLLQPGDSFSATRWFTTPKLHKCPSVRRAVSAHNSAASVEIDADGAATNTIELFSNQDSATNATSVDAVGALDELGAITANKNLQASACVDSVSRRRSHLSCARLAGIRTFREEHPTNWWNIRQQWPVDKTRDTQGFFQERILCDGDG